MRICIYSILFPIFSVFFFCRVFSKKKIRFMFFWQCLLWLLCFNLKGYDSCLEAGKSAETAITAAPSTEPAATSIDSAERVKDTGVDAVAGVYKVPHTLPGKGSKYHGWGEEYNAKKRERGSNIIIPII